MLKGNTAKCLGYFSGESKIENWEVKISAQMLVCAAFGFCNRKSIAKFWVNYFFICLK